MNESSKIAFIGGGNMAAGLIGGLINSNWSPANLSVSEPLAKRRHELTNQFGIGVFEDNAQCAMRAEVVVLAVKPQFLQAAAASIAKVLQRQKPLIISIIAGIRCKDLLAGNGEPLAVVRAMPNTPALVCAGISGLFANTFATAEQRDLAQTILRAVGETVWVERESLLDTVTAVSGSGPAYFFKLMELMAANAHDHGLDQQTANALAVQTALGAATLAKQSEHAPATLRASVTSPGGTTEAALEKMESLGLDNAVSQGIAAALKRAEQLADQFATNS